MAAKRLDGLMTWRSSFVGHDRTAAIGSSPSRLRRLTTIAARCAIVTILFLALPACQPPAPTSEKLQVERSALATPMFVQANSSTPQVPQDYVPVTYVGAQTLGNLNVVIVGWNDVTASVTSVMDGMGNNYQLAIGPTRSDLESQSIYYAANIAAAAPAANSVSVEFDTPAVYPDIRILEYAGVDRRSPFDHAVGAGADSGATASSGSLTTNRATDLLVAGNTLQTGTELDSLGAFTPRVVTDPDDDIAEDQVVTSIGTYSASSDLSSGGGWVMQLAAFHAADISAPTAPISLTATVASSTEIDLSWSSVTDDVNVGAFLVERCQGAGCSSFVQLGNFTVTTYASTGLTPNTSYSFRVRAVDGANNFGLYSPVATAITSSGCTSNSQCGTGFCVSGICCNSACSDGCGACNLAGHVGTCTAVPNGTVCRVANGPCDPADTCNGTSLACPANSPLPEGAACTDNNLCTVADHCHLGQCTGTNVACPSDFCHSAGTCDSATGLCVGATPINENSNCDDGNLCTASSQCKHGICVPEDPATNCSDPQGPYYAPLTNLGSRQGSSAAVDINNDGVVVGTDVHYTGAHEFAPSGEGVAFRWTADDGLDELQRPPGKQVSAWAISDDGEVVGTAWDPITPGSWMYRWDPTDQAQGYRIPGWIEAINASGQYTGTGVFDTQGFKLFRAQGGAFQQIPLPSGSAGGAGRAIDAAGTIVGFLQRWEGTTLSSIAMRYSDALGFEYLNQLVPAGSDWDIDPPGYSYQYATNGTQIVGTGSTDNGKVRGYVLTPSANGGPGSANIKMIGVPAGTPDDISHTVLPYRINSHGVVVGTVGDISNGPQHAFVWVDGAGTYDLNTFVDHDSGWVLRGALGINDGDAQHQPEIVGDGYFHGQQRAFKMRMPHLEPCEGADLCHIITRDPGSGDCSAPVLVNEAACQEGITLENDGVVDMGGGKLVAVFGFKNSGSSTVRPISNLVYRGVVQQTNPQPPPPMQFPPGDHPGTFLPTFNVGETVTWTVDGESISASVSSQHLTPVPIGVSGIGAHVCVPDDNGGQNCDTIVTIKADLDPYKVTPPIEPTAEEPPTTGAEYFGGLKGQLTVSPTGAAIYTVPISIPPGIAGMAPNLGLVYNSQGGDGIAGRGWDLSGLSMIYRCPRTRIEDGYARPVIMDELAKSDGSDTDGICLDGKRLYEFGLGSNVYFTERQEFKKIVRTGNVFEVTTKSGEVRRYGSRPDAQVLVPRESFDPSVPPTPGSEIAIWPLSQVYDPWGNYYDLHYNEDNQDFLQRGIRISKIEYTGHLDFPSLEPSACSTPPCLFNAITFTYEDRLDRAEVRNMRFHGTTVPRNSRLKTVTTPRGTYTLNYKPDEPILPSRLGEITYCTPAGCVDSLTFDWDGGDYRWEESPGYQPPASIDQYDGSGNLNQFPGSQFVDLNGDGLVEFVSAREGLPLKVWENTGQGFVSHDSWALPAPLIKSDGRTLAFLADVDGDGDVDLVTNTAVWLNRIPENMGWQQSTTFSAVARDFARHDSTHGPDWMGDLNGDGKADLVRMVDTNGLVAMDVRESTGTDWTVPNLGRSAFWEGTPQNGGHVTETVPASEFAQPTLWNFEPPLRDRHLQDINRDGLPDVVTNKVRMLNGQSVWDVWLNTGRPDSEYCLFVSDPTLRERCDTSVWKGTVFQADSGADAPAQQRSFVDLDGDGLFDVVTFSPQWGRTLAIPQDGLCFPDGCGESSDNPCNCPSALSSIAVKLAMATGNGYVAGDPSGHLSRLQSLANDNASAQRPFEQMIASQAKYRVAFGDVNGDGLVDMVQEQGLFETANQLWINTGVGWEPMVDEDALPALPSQDMQYNGKSGVAFVDLNGDGIQDLIRSSNTAGSLPRTAWINKFRPPVINHFPNGLADKSEVSYKVITTAEAKSDGTYTDSPDVAPGTTRLTAPIRVASSVATDNGQGFGQKTTVTYQYGNLRGSAFGRGPQGFGTVKVIEPAGTLVRPSQLVTTTTYAQAYPYTGLPLTVTRENQGMVSSTTTTYCDHFVDGLEGNDPDTCTPPTGRTYLPKSSMFVGPIKIVDVAYLRTSVFPLDSSSLPQTETVTTTTEYRNDTYGNPISVTVRTETPAVSTGETYLRITNNQFGLPGSEDQKMGKLTHSDTSTERVNPVLPPDHDNIPITHTTDFEYRDVGAAGGRVLSKKKVELGQGEGIELHVAYDYDSYGNLTTTTSCASDFENCAAGASGPPTLPYRTDRVSYDPQLFIPSGGAGLATSLPYGPGRFPVKATNAVGHDEFYVYDPLLGVATEHRQPDGMTVCHRYDGYGNQIEETTRCGLAGEELTTSVHVYRTTVNDPYPSALVTRTRPPNGADTWAYSDALGRTMQTLTHSFDGGFVKSETSYDFLGRIASETKPRVVHVDHGDVPYSKFYTYDQLGRVMKLDEQLATIDGDTHGTVSTVNTTYQGSTVLTERTVHGETRQRWERKNALGKIRSVDTVVGSISYFYDAEGNLTDAGDPWHALVPTVRYHYDKRGRKDSTTDPDLGRWTYQYNGFGDLITQTDGKTLSTTMTYDSIGRLRKKTAPSGASAEWLYDRAPGAGVGKLEAVISLPDPGLNGPCDTPSEATETDGNRVVKTFSYTAKGELQQNVQCVDGNTFTTTFTPDPLGRPSLVTYPEVRQTRLTVEYHYTSLGYLHYVSNATDNSIYWAATAMNAAGQVTDEYTGNGVETVSERNPVTGWLQSRSSTAHADGDTLIQNWAYHYDEAGNLRWRSRNDDVAGATSTETFGYDVLDRMNSAELAVTGTQPSDVTDTYLYDDTGNRIYKNNDHTTYTGCFTDTRAAGPHAVCTVAGSAPFHYDDNGNMTSGGGRSITYSASNKPTHIETQGTDAAAVDFIYDADDNRVVQSAGAAGNAGTFERTIYVGMGATGKSLYEQKTDANAITHTQFIYAGGAHDGNAFALRVVTDDGSANPVDATKYYHMDNLGSVTAVSDEVGHVLDATWAGEARAGVMSYDAWGGRRSPTGLTGPASFDLQAGNREFTSHETIPGVGLVNMNGRVYDPLLGRFLSPDPTIQFPGDLQSYNRYSYVLNNPLSYRDPTGYSIVPSFDTVMNYAIGVAGIVGCVGTEGAGCSMAFAFIGAMYNAQAMLQNGATYGQVITVSTVGIVAGQFGGTIGGAVGSQFGQNMAGSLIGGAVSGAIGATMTTAYFGGSLGWNAFRGAIDGALWAGLSWGTSGAGPLTKADEASSESVAFYNRLRATLLRDGELQPIDPRVFQPWMTLWGPSPVWYRLTDDAIEDLNPLFSRFGTELRKVQIRFDESEAQSETKGNRIVFGADFIGGGKLTKTETLLHELVHAAQYQSIGILAMDWRWYSDRRQFGADEAHGLYNIYPALKVQTQYNIDIVSSRFSLESIADQFADRVWASGQFRPF